MVDRLGCSAVVLAMASMLMAGCGGPSHLPVRSAGPDANLSRLPDSLEEGSRWPSDSLQFMVVRPSRDQSPDGRSPSIDSRMTLAVLDPDRATWVMSARMDDQQGISFASGLESLLSLQTLRSAGVGPIPLQATLKRQPSKEKDLMVLPRGRWEIGAIKVPTDADPGTRITLRLISEQDVLNGEVVMNMAQAEDLFVRVSGAIQAVRP
ncbi:MAG: hypothetical protein MK089_11020 [Phycisphaerales bacterium]|nr:hypothetical protein [Phycisphaerales bacterium]